MARLRKATYWMGSGRSRLRLVRMRSISLGGVLSGTRTLSGSPRSQVRPKTISETPRMTPSPWSTRWARKLTQVSGSRGERGFALQLGQNREDGRFALFEHRFVVGRV